MMTAVWYEEAMVALRHKPAVKAAVISDPTVMSGDPVVRGTRVLADSVVAYIRAAYTNKELGSDW